MGQKDASKKLIAKLEETVEELRAALLATQERLDQKTGELKRAMELLEHIRMTDLGVKPRYAAIQQLIPVSSEVEAAKMIQALKVQEGCLGGRPIPSVWNGKTTWQAQVFWETEVVPASWMCGVMNNILPDGQRYCMILPGQRLTLGIEQGSEL